MKTHWTLEKALELVCLLNACLLGKYYVGLTGSVLFKGTSEHDLDLIVYPASSEWQDKDLVRDTMRDIMKMSPLFDRAYVTKKWRERGSDDHKHVEVWEWRGRRVDIFFLS